MMVKDDCAIKIDHKGIPIRKVNADEVYDFNIRKEFDIGVYMI